MWLAWETRMVSLKGLNFAFNRVQTLSFCWELWHFGLSPRSSVSSMSSGAQAVRLWKEGAIEHSIETAMNAAFCSFIRQLEQFCIFILFSCDPMVLIRVVYGSTQLTIAYTAEENVCPPPINHCPHGSPQGGWVPWIPAPSAAGAALCRDDHSWCVGTSATATPCHPWRIFSVLMKNYRQS